MLSVEDLHKSYGGLKAVSGASFHVEEGKITALIGPNGAGKTTIFNIISGLIRPDKGKIIFKGEDITKLSPHRRAHLGISRTFQDVRIFEDLTVEENLLLGIIKREGESIFNAVFGRKRDYLTKEEEEKIENILALLEIPSVKRKQLAGQLSYGELKLVALGRALMSDPVLMLLDEPTAGIDERSLLRVQKIVRGLIGRGVTVLLVEHNMRSVSALADWIIFLHEGRVISQGVFEEISKDELLTQIYFGSGKRRTERERIGKITDS